MRYLWDITFCNFFIKTFVLSSVCPENGGKFVNTSRLYLDSQHTAARGTAWTFPNLSRACIPPIFSHLHLRQMKDGWTICTFNQPIKNVDWKGVWIHESEPQGIDKLENRPLPPPSEDKKTWSTYLFQGPVLYLMQSSWRMVSFSSILKYLCALFMRPVQMSFAKSDRKRSDPEKHFWEMQILCVVQSISVQYNA